MFEEEEEEEDEAGGKLVFSLFYLVLRRDC